MRIRTALRTLGLLTAGFLLLGTGPGPARSAPADPGGADAVPATIWQAGCGSGQGPGCTVSARTEFTDARGARARVTVTFYVDQGCTSLHVDLPGRLDSARPAWVQLDGGAPHQFYRPGELADLAEALDDGRPPHDATSPELAAFWREVQGGGVGSHAQATAELIARFARLKDDRKLGIGCEATARMLPALLSGSVLRIGYHAARTGTVQPYHWPAKDRREVAIGLAGLPDALRSLTKSH